MVYDRLIFLKEGQSVDLEGYRIMNQKNNLVLETIAPSEKKETKETK